MRLGSLLSRLGSGDEHTEPDKIVFFNTVDFWQLMLYGYILTNLELDIGIQRRNGFIL